MAILTASSGDAIPPRRDAAFQLGAFREAPGQSRLISSQPNGRLRRLDAINHSAGLRPNFLIFVVIEKFRRTGGL